MDAPLLSQYNNLLDSESDSHVGTDGLNQSASLIRVATQASLEASDDLEAGPLLLPAPTRESPVVLPDWTYETRAFLHYYLATEVRPYSETYRNKSKMRLESDTPYREKYEKTYKPLFHCFEKEKYALGKYYQKYVVERSIALQNLWLEWHLDGRIAQLCFGPDMVSEKAQFGHAARKEMHYGCECFIPLFKFFVGGCHQVIKLAIVQHLTLQSLRVWLTPTELLKHKYWRLEDDKVIMWFGAVASIGIFVTWVAAIAKGWLDDYPQAYYFVSAYVFAPVLLAALDPRELLRIKKAVAFLFASVFMFYAFAIAISKRLVFLGEADQLCDAIKGELTSPNYVSDGNSYRTLYCYKAYIAHHGIYGDITAASVYVGLLVILALLFLWKSFKHGVAEYRQESTPREEALERLKRARDHFNNEDNPDIPVNASYNHWIVAMVAGSVSILIFYAVVAWHLVPKYDKDRSDAFTAQFILNQAEDGVNPKTYADTVDIVRDAQWIFTPFLAQERDIVLPALAVFAMALLVMTYYKYVESGNSFNTLSERDIERAELELLRSSVKEIVASGNSFNTSSKSNIESKERIFFDSSANELHEEGKCSGSPGLPSGLKSYSPRVRASSARLPASFTSNLILVNQAGSDGSPADIDMTYPEDSEQQRNCMLM